MDKDLLQDPAEQASLARLSEGLRDYMRISGKLSAALLAQKGGQLLYGNQNPKTGAVFPGLTQLFMEQSPEQGSIWAAARARGFRVGRKQYGGDLAPRAYLRAREMMGSYKSILVTVNPSTGALKFVRSGVRKARVHFRYGRQSFPVSGDFTGPLRHDLGEKRLNLRAVATFFELQKREQGRRFLGASWLHRRWRKQAKLGYVPEGTPGLAPGWGSSRQFGGTFTHLVNANPRSQIQPLGTATLGGDEAAGNVELRISSYVPGVRAIGNARGLFVRAIDAVRADLDQYIARKHAETLAAAVRAGITLPAGASSS